MIRHKTGDIFKEETEALVNTVNCVGVMGRGIALQFKKQFPQNFRAYEEACEKKEVVPGKMFVYKTDSLINPKYVINFPTKRHWRAASRMEDIESGLQDLVEVITKNNIASIALPSLGSGLGGLVWAEVRARIEHTLSQLPNVTIIVFEPPENPEAEKMVKASRVPNMTPGRAVLVELMHRYLADLLYPFVSLLEVHKFMYFLQEGGERLNLKYQKKIYGPYAENLRHVLNAVEGHLLTGYADGGDRPDKELKLLPGAYEKASRFLKKHTQTKRNFDKVSELIEGFESPFGLELLATVHWVATKENAASTAEVVQKVHQWNERKKQFSPRQIELAYKVLAEKGWLAESQV